MDPSKEKLLHHLLKLTGENNSLLPEPTKDSSADPDLNIDLDIGARRVPDALAISVTKIMQMFDQAESSNMQLTQELLSCYEQLNTAFSAITNVARCKTIRQVLASLTSEISRAINSRYDIYVGPYQTKFSLPPGQVAPHKNIVFCPSGGKDIDITRKFYRQYESQLQILIQNTTDCQVQIIGYNPARNSDYQGKGNVLSLRLTSREEKNAHHGTLLFIRSGHQLPYDASEMNLGASLAQMGSAVLDNIISAQKLQDTSIQTIASLVKATEAKDAYTSGHSARVAELACRLGRYLGLDNDQIKMLQWAGMLHDIGKIGIKDDVLSKPGKLTADEFDHLKTHSQKSFQVLQPVEALQNVLPAVKHHHEHFDGSGYPDGLKGDKIPLLARILQIADVWDALTSNRSYRAAMTDQKARQIMRDEAGTTMDPDLVKSFLEMLQ